MLVIVLVEQEAGSIQRAKVFLKHVVADAETVGVLVSVDRHRVAIEPEVTVRDWSKAEKATKFKWRKPQ